MKDDIFWLRQSSGN